MTTSLHPIAKALLAWYRTHRRMLPWREHPDPYRVWVSEIMLQQTRVDTVIPYYVLFLDRFPTLEALAAAPADAVLKAWENLGYYSRARHLHRAARMIVEQCRGEFPVTPEGWMALPGVGRYTAGAILSIAFGKPIPALDGNVRRVLCRLFAVRENADRPDTRNRLLELAASLIPKRAPGSFNQALMDLGALVCTPRSPACSSCPLRAGCRARREGLQGHLPLSERRPPTPHERATAAVLRDRQGRVMMVRRPAQGLLASLWKLPGGIIGRGESWEAGLQRTVREELGIRIRVGERITSVQHAYTHFRITLTAYRCARISGRPRPLACQDWRWASPQVLDALALSRADRAVISAI